MFSCTLLTSPVVRPAGYENQSLPVLMWIYGGGLTAGSSADPQYNVSGIVKTGSDLSPTIHWRFDKLPPRCLGLPAKPGYPSGRLK